MAPPKVNAQIKARGKDVDWYKADIGEISEPARQLLQDYSRIHPGGIVRHVAHTNRGRRKLLVLRIERSRLGHIPLSLHRPMPFP